MGRTTDDACGPTSHAFVSQRLRLNYLDWGNAAAPTLILLHGGRDHARSWDWTARALRRDWHVVAPDLRGHGDSAWSPDAAYLMPYFIVDLAQLIRQLDDAPVAIVGHSLGGAIALNYAGYFPERIGRIAAIEGLGLSPAMAAERAAEPFRDRWRDWIEQRPRICARPHRRFASFAEAHARMREANAQLSEAVLDHLTLHALARNEDGSWSWKFDPALRDLSAPLELPIDQLQALWRAIECPAWLVHGRASWASNPAIDRRADHFRNAHVTSFEGAGHWVHHDRFDAFLAELRIFLGTP